MPSAKLLTRIRPVCLQRRRKAPWRLPGRLYGARRLRSVLQQGRQGPPSLHSAATSTIRALGQAGRCLVPRPEAPRVWRTSVPAHTVSPRDPPWAVPIPERTSVGPESQTRRNSRHAARARSGGAGPRRSPPAEGAREVSAGIAGTPRVLARVCQLRTRCRDYPFLSLFCVSMRGALIGVCGRKAGPYLKRYGYGG